MAEGQIQPKRTPENRASILESLSEGLAYVHACNYAGISVDTFDRWRKDDADFADDVKKAEAEFVKRAFGKITIADAWQAQAWQLERRFPTEYGLPQAIERALLKLGFVLPASPSPDSPKERPKGEAD